MVLIFVGPESQIIGLMAGMFAVGVAIVALAFPALLMYFLIFPGDGPPRRPEPPALTRNVNPQLASRLDDEVFRLGERPRAMPPGPVSFETQGNGVVSSQRRGRASYVTDLAVRTERSGQDAIAVFRVRVLFVRRQGAWRAVRWTPRMRYMSRRAYACIRTGDPRMSPRYCDQRNPKRR